MSYCSPKRNDGFSQKSQSYPGTPRSQRQVCVNLTDVFQGHDNDLTITPNDQSTAYQTALEETEIDTYNERNNLHEMEKLRHQLQSVMNPLGKEMSHGDPLNSSSTSSVDTIALLRSALPHTSPELQLDENGVLMTSLNSNTSRNMFRPTTSPTLLDSSIVAENTILKENIEKERCRRKHCEQQIHELQDKLLESQEHLAVAESTERKKGIMMEQLDQTLASVVDGWKKQEVSRMESYNQLKEQNDDLQASKDRQEELLNKFELELREAVDALIKEQEKFKHLENVHQKKFEEHRKEFDILQNEMQKLQGENLKFEEQKHDLLEQKEIELTKKDEIVADLKKNFELARLQVKKLREKSNDTEEKLAGIIQGLEEQLETTGTKVNELSKSLKEKEEKARTLETDLENTTREKETLSMEVSLLNSRYDALKTKQDSEMRLKLESEFNEQILHVQKQITMTENELKNSQKKQITDLSRRHKENLEKQKKIFQQALEKKDEMLHKLRLDYNRDMEEAKNEISSLSMAGQSLEVQRSELTNRVKHMMQQHWEDTVTLLSGDPRSMAQSGHSTNLPEQLSSTFRSEFQQQQHLRQQQQPPLGISNNLTLYGSQRQPTVFNDDVNIRASSVTQPMLPGYFPPYPSHLSRDKVAPYTQHTPGTSAQRLFPNTPHNNEHFPSRDKVAPYDQYNFEGVYSTDEVAPYNRYDVMDYGHNKNQHARSLMHPLNRSSSPVFKSNENPSWLQSTNQYNAPTRDKSSIRILNSNAPIPTTSSSIKYTTHHIAAPSVISSITNDQYNFPDVMEHEKNMKYAINTRPNFENSNYRSGISEQPAHHNKPDYKQKATSEAKEEAVSLLYQDIDDELGLTNKTNATGDDETLKQQQLGHFIEKLLERSPGQPLDEIPVKEVSESIQHEVDQLLRHTPKKQPIRSNSAFKKSVVKKTPNSEKEPLTDEPKNFTEEQLMFMLKQLINKENPDKLPKEKSTHDYDESSSWKDASHSSDLPGKKHSKKTAETKPVLQKKTGKSLSSRLVPSKEQKRDLKPRSRSSSAWK